MSKKKNMITLSSSGALQSLILGGCEGASGVILKETWWLVIVTKALFMRLSFGYRYSHSPIKSGKVASKAVIR